MSDEPRFKAELDPHYDSSYPWRVAIAIDGQARFRNGADAQAYCDWRNAAPVPAPKFKVGDRVVFSDKSVYAVEAGPAWWLVPIDPVGREEHYHMEEDMELAPPEPPKWEVARNYSTHSGHPGGWCVLRGSEIAGTLHSESDAQHLAAMKNAQAES